MSAMRVTPRFLLLPAVYVEEKYNVRVCKIYFELLKKIQPFVTHTVGVYLPMRAD